MPEFFAKAYNKRYYFSPVKIMATLNGLYFRIKRKLVEFYIKKCVRCGEFRNNNYKFIRQF